MNFCFFLLNSQVLSRHLASGTPDRGKIIVLINVGGPLRWLRTIRLDHVALHIWFFPSCHVNFLEVFFRFLSCHFPCSARGLVKSSRPPAKPAASNFNSNWKCIVRSRTLLSKVEIMGHYGELFSVLSNQYCLWWDKIRTEAIIHFDQVIQSAGHCSA